MKDEDIIADIFQTRNTDVYFFEHMMKCMELARQDEREKAKQEVASAIFGWLDNQPDGEHEDFVREYQELRQKYLKKPKGEK